MFVKKSTKRSNKKKKKKKSIQQFYIKLTISFGEREPVVVLQVYDWRKTGWMLLVWRRVRGEKVQAKNTAAPTKWCG